FIYAEGRGGGGKNKKSKLRVVKYNELYNLMTAKRFNSYFQNYFREIGMDENVVKSIYELGHNLRLIDIINRGIIGAEKISGLFHSIYPCPVFIKDTEATTLEQLKTIVTRKMSALQMNALNIKYKVYGHTFG